MAHDEPGRDHWRHRHARKLSRPWRKALPDVFGGVIVGAGGGTWIASTVDLPPAAEVFIGIGIAIFGAFLPWVTAYVIHWCRAGTVTTRARLADVEALLDGHLNPPVPAVSAVREELGVLLSEMLDAAEDFELFHDDRDRDEAQAVRKRVIKLQIEAENQVRKLLGNADLALMQAAVQEKADGVEHRFVEKWTPDMVSWQCLRVQAAWLKKRLSKMKAGI